MAQQLLLPEFTTLHVRYHFVEHAIIHVVVQAAMMNAEDDAI